MIGASFADAKILGRKDALHDQKIGGPIAQGDHAAQSEHDADPMDAHGIVAEDPSVRQRCVNPVRENYA